MNANRPTGTKLHMPFKGHRTVAEWDRPVGFNSDKAQDRRTA